MRSMKAEGELDSSVASGLAMRRPERGVGAVAGKLLLHLAFLAIAVVAYGAHEHFKLNGESTPALASLLAAAGFGLAPVRALVHAIFALEGRLLHLVHGAGGLALLGLTAGGVVSGGPLLTHAAMAPFAIMGAAQAVMHQNHPRNREQAEALRRFATSLPEVRELAASRDLTSPANVRRAVEVLTDLLGKAQALGETELRSDPGFQSALRRATARFGLALGLDAADQAIGKLAATPSGAAAVPDLRRRLASARRAAGEGTPRTPAGQAAAKSP
jgi:hypothetical protein